VLSAAGAYSNSPIVRGLSGVAAFPTVTTPITYVKWSPIVLGGLIPLNRFRRLCEDAIAVQNFHTM
jgi:hypothetical protein